MAVLTLLENPEQSALLRAGPDAPPHAMDELVRIANPIPTAAPRYPTEDTGFAGIPFCKRGLRTPRTQAAPERIAFGGGLSPWGARAVRRPGAVAGNQRFTVPARSRSIMCRVVSIGVSSGSAPERGVIAALSTATLSFHSSCPAKGIVSPSS